MIWRYFYKLVLKVSLMRLFYERMWPRLVYVFYQTPSQNYHTPTVKLGN